MPDPKAVLVVGAGDATGGAIARRFAREGYVACVTRGLLVFSAISDGTKS